MRLDLRDVVNTPEARKPFQFQLDLSEIELYGRRPIANPVLVEGCVTNHAGALVLEGTARSTLELACDRCGREFSREKIVRLESLVAQQLEDYPLEKGSATVVYFYRLTCEECIQTEEEFMDSLPEQVEADGKSYPLQVVRINTRSGSNNEILQAFFEAYQVPEEDQMVPIVFTSQGYLAGYEDITQNLLPQLEAGAGLNFQYPG